MRMFLGRLALSIAAVGTMFISGSAMADPVDITFTVTGPSGNYDIDFTVGNNVGGDQAVYFFGVELSANDVNGNPGLFDSSIFPTWDNSPYGGSNLIYNNVWIESGAGIPPNGSLSGFVVHSTDVTAPSSIHWFAYSTGNDLYLGGGNFHNSVNPGFEGVVSSGHSAVPEPSTLALAGLGCLGLAIRAIRHRREIRV
jgi:hypothetical protein